MIGRRLVSSCFRKAFHQSVRSYQVTILGGASELGQAISILLRDHPSISKLVLFDVKESTPGVVVDLSHIPSESAVRGFYGEDNMDRALKQSDLVLAVGDTLKPGLTKKVWLEENARFMTLVAARVAKLNPLPFLGVVTDPINVIVPMMAEIMKTNGSHDPKKLFGITSDDPLRAQALYAVESNVSVSECYIPVIGGHTEKTMIPLLSQARPACKMNERAIQELTHRIRRGNEYIFISKNGCSPILSVAYGVLNFSLCSLDALSGKRARLNAYVENNDFGTGYFSGLVDVDHTGACDMKTYTNLSPLECYLLEQATDQLRKDVLKGKKFLELA